MSDIKHELDKMRSIIDDIDDQLLRLLDLRANAAKQVGVVKKAIDEDMNNIKDVQREEAIIQRLIQHSEGPLTSDQISEIFALIFAQSRQIQTEIKDDNS